MERVFLKDKTYRNDIRKALNAVPDRNKLSGKTILITGATGLLGSVITDMLLFLNDTEDFGVRIYAAGRNKAGLTDRFGDRPDLFFVPYDIMDPEGVDIQCDYVIHAAGNSDPAAFNTDPVGTIAGNVNGTYELLKNAEKSGCTRFIYISSGEVYGKSTAPGKADIPEKGYEESDTGSSDPLSIRSNYPISKMMAENLCVSFCSQYKPDTVIVRPCHLYGAAYRDNDSHAYAQFFNNALSGNDIIMKSRGSQQRSYIYVMDCASGVLSALINGESSEAYNIADPDSVLTVAELAEHIAEAAGVHVVFKEPDDRDIRDRSPIERQVLDPSKLMALGWKPSFSAREGIEHSFDIIKNMSGEQNVQ